MDGDPVRAGGPDFSLGVPLAAVPDGGSWLGHVAGEPAILIRRGLELWAVAAACSHRGASLSEGLVDGAHLRCPRHHACFDLRSGEARRAPALAPLTTWRVEVVRISGESRGAMVHVRERRPLPTPRPATALGRNPSSVVIVGGGAAGTAAALTLRAEGYRGPVTVLSADAAPPCDRTRLSTSFLAGDADEASLGLRPDGDMADRDIDLRLDAEVTALDTAAREVRLADGARHSYGALLLATGAAPVRLEVQGSDRPHVLYLRSLADARALSARAGAARCAVVVGAGFVGLEVAAALRSRGLAVRVVAPDRLPLQAALGVAAASFLRRLHERHGVVFHLGRRPDSVGAQGVTLDDGEVLPADLVVAAVGVRPALDLPRRAGLVIDRGVLVDAYLETSASGVYAAGDIACWPDRITGRNLRVEHWVVAQRQGQTAARNILGLRERFEAAPFFWTEHYGVTLSRIGHADPGDRERIAGALEASDAAISHLRAGEVAAMTLVGRDRAGLDLEKTLESRALDLPRFLRAG